MHLPSHRPRQPAPGHLPSTNIVVPGRRGQEQQKQPTQRGDWGGKINRRENAMHPTRRRQDRAHLLFFYKHIDATGTGALQGSCAALRSSTHQNAKKALLHVFIFIIFWGVRFILTPQSLRDYKYLMPSERKTKPSRNDN